MNINDLFNYKSQRKLKFEIKSFFKNIITFDIELTNKPIKIFGYDKKKVKSFRIMKQFKVIKDGMNQFH
jgi:hypothetical protein